MTQAATIEFLKELRRVLGGDATGTDFFHWRVAPTDEQAREATAWLRSLPTALGERGLELRTQEEFGPPSA